MASSFSRYIDTPQGKPFAEKFSQCEPKERVNCIVCGSDKSRLWYQMGEFSAKRCLECGCSYISPRFDDVQLAEHYGEDLFTSAKDYEGVHHNMLDASERERKRNDMKIEIDAVMNHLPDGGKVLDVGCQTGIFLEALPDRYEKFGVERSQWAAQYTQQHVSKHVFSGKIEEANFESETFDAINMSYVLEHLQYPAETMARIVGWLKHDGLLIVSIPNFGSICGVLFREFYRLADPRQHIYLTTVSNSEHLLEKFGIQIEKVHRPYWGTDYCSVKQLCRLVSNAGRCLSLPILLKMGLVPEVDCVISPPFWGNIVTIVGRKQGDDV